MDTAIELTKRACLIALCSFFLAPYSFAQKHTKSIAVKLDTSSLNLQDITIALGGESGTYSYPNNLKNEYFKYHNLVRFYLNDTTRYMYIAQNRDKIYVLNSNFMLQDSIILVGAKDYEIAEFVVTERHIVALARCSRWMYIYDRSGVLLNKKKMKSLKYSFNYRTRIIEKDGVFYINEKARKKPKRKVLLAVRFSLDADGQLIKRPKLYAYIKKPSGTENPYKENAMSLVGDYLFFYDRYSSGNFYAFDIDSQELTYYMHHPSQVNFKNTLIFNPPVYDRFTNAFIQNTLNKDTTKNIVIVNKENGICRNMIMRSEQLYEANDSEDIGAYSNKRSYYFSFSYLLRREDFDFWKYRLVLSESK